MKPFDSSSPSCRRRRSTNPTLAACCYAAITIFCSHRDDGIICCLPGANSFQYDDRKSLSFNTLHSVLEARGGGGDSDDIDLQTSSQLTQVQLQIDTSTPSALENFSIYPIIGQRAPSKGLWKRIRMIRGGVEDKKHEDESLEVEGNDKENDSTASSTTKESDTCETPNDEKVSSLSGKSLEDTNNSSSIQIDEEGNEGVSKQVNQGKEGGVFSSFFSLFRAPTVPVESEDPIETETNTAHIAHKIPHGPNGRGGGSSLYATMPSTEDLDEQEDEVEEFLITTEVTEVSTDATTAGTVELTKSLSSVSEAAVRNRGDSTAFVVPPPHKPLPSSSVDNSKRKDVKKSKASKTKVAAPDIDGTKTMEASLNITRNETVAIKASNETVDSNTTGFLSTSNASVSEDSSDVIEISQLEDYTSSGYWTGIDLVASFGLSSLSEDLKISRALRPVRKAAARATGLHGFISGKVYHIEPLSNENNVTTSTVISIDEELGIHDANALEAEMLASRVASRHGRRGRDARARTRGRPGRRWGFRRGQHVSDTNGIVTSDYVLVPTLDPSPDALEYRRRKRVEDIDRLLQRGSERLLELQCERDDLLCAPNPLFNYTKKYDPSTNHTFGDVRTTREFNFPPSELVDEYIEELVSHGRLITMNHTELWQSRSDSGMDDDDDEIVGDDLLTPSADAGKLYENLDQLEGGMNRNGNKNKSGGGSWLLRTGFGRNGGSLGEKLGETIEIQAYKGVCSAVMMVFARMLSGLHGVNVLLHSDIRTYIEQDPDLPPVDNKYGPLLNGDNNYAQQAIKTAMQKGSKKKRKTSKHGSSNKSSSRRHGHELSEDAFIQRDAVVETLISHCQISAPLLKLFPLDWQRAMVGNIITLVTAIISDFADGLQVQILGHTLTISFKPITEADLIQHIGVGGFRHNHRRTRPDEFEAAVLATAQDMSESLAFLDGWLEWAERRIGGGVLRSQIGNLIARVVLTLVDEVLSGARLDMWSSQANGPRLYAALEYRTSSKDEEEEKEEPINE
ncbi:hypothetical protein ACHAXR_008127 [Thalassiosira sp. AJA248-18]